MKEHDRICIKKIVHCPNSQCSMKMERSKIWEHVKDICEFTEVTCKYEIIGCKVKRKRRDMKVHEESDDKVHLRKALDAIVELKRALKKVFMVKFKFTGYNNQVVKKSSEPFISPSFQFGESTVMSFLIFCNSYPLHLSVAARNTPDDKPFTGMVTVTILNQLEDENHYTKKLDNAEKWAYSPNFIPLSKLSHDQATNTQYLMNDTLYFRVAVELPNSKPWLD